MGWYEAIRDAGDVALKLHDAELNQHLATLRMEGAKLAEENARLREELILLREAARVRDEMTFRANVYWRRDGADETGPFCPKCWDDGRKPVRMLDQDEYDWICSVCSGRIFKPGGEERFNAARASARDASRRRDRQW